MEDGQRDNTFIEACLANRWLARTYSDYVDCDDALLLIARGDDGTLTGVEGARLGHHLLDCETCRTVSDLEGAGEQTYETYTEPMLAMPDASSLRNVERRIFNIEGTIGLGGMGKVVRARDRYLARTVAIKEAISATHRPRLEREARITARLQHPAIVPVYEAGTFDDGEVFYTMPLLRGRTLAHKIKACTTFPERLGLIPSIIAVVEAIAYAHSEGVIHRDLKPSNVLIGEYGETVVIDWGIAKELGTTTATEADEVEEAPRENDSVELTRLGAVLGTPGFMSPEQAAGEPAARQADVYALGAMLYTLLSGHPPFWDEDLTPDRLMRRMQFGTPTSIAELAPETPGDLVAIVEKAMSLRTEERYADAKGMAIELSRFQAGLLLKSRQYGRRELLARWFQRHRSLVLLSGASLLTLAIVASIAVSKVLVSRDDEERARQRAEKALVEAQESQYEQTFQRARSAIEVDPTETLAWLKRYPERGKRNRAAGLLAAEAHRRGSTWRIFESTFGDPGKVDLSEGGFLTTGPPLQRWSLQSAIPESIAWNVMAERKSGKRDCIATNKGVTCQERNGQERRWVAPDRIEAVKFHKVGLDGGAVITLREGGAVLLDLETWTDRRVLTNLRMAPKFWILPSQVILASLTRAWILPLSEGDPLPLTWTAQASPGTQPVEPQNLSHVGNVAIPNTKGTTRVAITAKDSSGKRSVLALALDGGSGVVMQAPWSQESIFVALAISGDAGRIAVATDTGSIGVFDAISGKLLRAFETEESYIFSLTLDRAGKRVFAATEAGVVWEAETTGKEPARRRFDERGELYSLALSNDDELLATASGRGRIHVDKINESIDLGETSVRTLQSAENCNATIGAARHGDSRWIYCNDEGDDGPHRYIRISDSGAIDEVIVPWPTGDGDTLISEDGTTLFSSGETVSTVWNAGTARELSIAASDTTQLSQDGKTLWTTDKAINKWNLESGTRVATIDVDAITALGSRDGSLLLAELPSGLAILDSSGAIMSSHSAHWNYDPLHWSADSSAAITSTGDTTLVHYSHSDRRWRRLSGEQSGGWSAFHTTSISDDGTVVGAVNGSNVMIWLPTEQVVWKFHWAGLMSCFVTNDGVHLETEDEEFTVPFPRFSHAKLHALTNAAIDENGRLVGVPQQASDAEQP